MSCFGEPVIVEGGDSEAAKALRCVRFDCNTLTKKSQESEECICMKHTGL